MIYAENASELGALIVESMRSVMREVTLGPGDSVTLNLNDENYEMSFETYRAFINDSTQFCGLCEKFTRFVVNDDYLCAECRNAIS